MYVLYTMMETARSIMGINICPTAYAHNIPSSWLWHAYTKKSVKSYKAVLYYAMQSKLFYLNQSYNAFNAMCPAVR